MENTLNETGAVIVAQDAASTAATITQEIIEEWKKQHGSVLKVTTDVDSEEKDFYFRKPPRVIFNRFIDESSKKTSKAMEIFVNDCLLYPTKLEMYQLADQQPGLIPQLANEVLNAYGMGGNFTINKL